MELLLSFFPESVRPLNARGVPRRAPRSIAFDTLRANAAVRACVASAPQGGPGAACTDIRANRSGTWKFLPGRAGVAPLPACYSAANRVAHRLLAPEAARRGSLFRKRSDGHELQDCRCDVGACMCLWQCRLPQTPSYDASTGTAASAGAAGTAGMAGPASAASPSTSFDDLAGSKGYITQQDAQHDAWLSGHFSECDANHDGKLTRQEYAEKRFGDAGRRVASDIDTLNLAIPGRSSASMGRRAGSNMESNDGKGIRNKEFENRTQAGPGAENGGW
ncbi:MAG TPA: hypothetical protein VIG31_10245 [Rhodanobacteraceae bacterium]|jgi:hypothetical protein